MFTFLWNIRARLYRLIYRLFGWPRKTILQRKWKVYKDPEFEPGQDLLGYKGTSQMVNPDTMTPYLTAPYVPFEIPKNIELPDRW